MCEDPIHLPCTGLAIWETQPYAATLPWCSSATQELCFRCPPAVQGTPSAKYPTVHSGRALSRWSPAIHELCHLNAPLTAKGPTLAHLSCTDLVLIVHIQQEPRLPGLLESPAFLLLGPPGNQDRHLRIWRTGSGALAG